MKKSRRVSGELGRKIVIEGASREVCEALGVPPHWADCCEDSFRVGHDGTSGSLKRRVGSMIGNLDTDEDKWFVKKIEQLGSYGGGNHFGECEAVELVEDRRLGTLARPVSELCSSSGSTKRDGQECPSSVAEVFGLKHNCVAFLSHCGSRGWGHRLATGQFKAMQDKFKLWDIPLPGGDRELVYAPLGTAEGPFFR